LNHQDFFFTSESVTEGHPDKISDRISDAILDAVMVKDPLGRVACETLVTTGLALISGEITTDSYVDMPHIVRDTIKQIGYTEKCEIQISYAIGMVEPVSIMVDTFETGKIADEKLTMIVEKHFDMTPSGIIKRLDLRRPIYTKTAAYGHFGREEAEFTWEKTDYVDILRAAAPSF
jgi:S-adenosylmethionine synthetase